ncbi:MAG TPA: hypothetical protein DDX19_22330 [Rhodopirellula baltica]|nr:hypothetical protein [Rhodopirellula baltica]
MDCRTVTSSIDSAWPGGETGGALTVGAGSGEGVSAKVSVFHERSSTGTDAISSHRKKKFSKWWQTFAGACVDRENLARVKDMS